MWAREIAWVGVRRESPSAPKPSLQRPKSTNLRKPIVGSTLTSYGSHYLQQRRPRPRVTGPYQSVWRSHRIMKHT